MNQREVKGRFGLGGSSIVHEMGVTRAGTGGCHVTYRLLRGGKGKNSKEKLDKRRFTLVLGYVALASLS